jgi:hypothetical protein
VSRLVCGFPAFRSLHRVSPTSPLSMLLVLWLQRLSPKTGYARRSFGQDPANSHTIRQTKKKLGGVRDPGTIGLQQHRGIRFGSPHCEWRCVRESCAWLCTEMSHSICRSVVDTPAKTKKLGASRLGPLFHWLSHIANCRISYYQ